MPSGTPLPVAIHQHGGYLLLAPLTWDGSAPSAGGRVDGAILEFGGAQGLTRLHGEVSLTDPQLLVFRARLEEIDQRRAHVRVGASQPVTLLRPGGGQRWDARTVNISGGGMLVTGADGLQIDQRVVFVLGLEPGAPPVQGVARVGFTRGEAGWALAYELIDEEDRDRIIRFVFGRMRRAQATVSGRTSGRSS